MALPSSSSSCDDDDHSLARPTALANESKSA
eukprot:CAMPEP_0113518872 /NCGR_PEP_ID=MMETSP0014_2-20120614/43205_1 /TAXON_ID=2857 /ORGANISM="Nitzschia sp." /LENGTH=30 /DNA_ID=CAMNT_0000416527 /DNA_START=88 /DNA_END=176 /DNA_ORIENTATION=+ /assembly_acc=CAM_ASM_000159